MEQQKPRSTNSHHKSREDFLNKTGAFISDLVGSIINFLKPDPVIWKGAGWGLAGMVLVLVFLKAILLIKSLGVSVAGLMVLFYIGLSLVAGTGIYFGLKLVTAVPASYRFVLFAAGVALIAFWMGNNAARIVLVIYSLLVSSILGGALAVVLSRKWGHMNKGKKILNLAVMTTGGGMLLFGFIWLFMEGVPSDPPDNAILQAEYRPPHITLGDPSRKGSYSVLELTYGSGKDRHRSEFGKKVNILTDSVDGSRYVSDWEKLHGWMRTRYWGFDDKAMPRNAKVWYPDGKGPFPLILIVHGNHGDREFSDPGYEYLARLMASRGFIFASVDQNFLNVAWYDIFGHLKNENDCRAWLLLKHLELWRKWNMDPITPFYGKVNLEKIGLIGHSRGGEAVAIAACFNRLPHNPDDATLDFDFNFNLRTVIAIAPVDGQFNPAGAGTILEDISYFVIQGSNDMDLRTFEGTRQFQRTMVGRESSHVKASLYVFGANHGQFNSVWGRNDNDFPYMALFNKRELLVEKDQVKIGKVFISGFLEATLNGKTEYLSLFRDYRSGLQWLPETIYLNQYEDPGCELICTFEEDFDVTTTTFDGGKIEAENLTVWREQTVPLKWGTQGTRAVYAGWNRQAVDSVTGILSIEHSQAFRIGIDSLSYLYFVMADAREDSNPYPSGEGKGQAGRENRRKQADHSGKAQGGNKSEEEENKGPIDLTIVLVDSAGHQSALPLSAYSFLSRQLEPKLMKAGFMTDIAKSELVFQVFFYPLSAFREQNNKLDIRRIREIQFVFDRTENGVVAIDNIGFWRDLFNAAI